MITILSGFYFTNRAFVPLCENYFAHKGTKARFFRFKP